MRYDELKEGACNALIWNKQDDTFLFILRSDLVNLPLQWCLPGGHMEKGEKPLEALYRELVEEIGQDLSGMPVVQLTESETHEPYFIHRNYAICVPKRFKPTLNWEHVEHKWKSLEEMPRPNVWHLDLLLSNDKAGNILKRWQDGLRKAG